MFSFLKSLLIRDKSDSLSTSNNGSSFKKTDLASSADENQEELLAPQSSNNHTYNGSLYLVDGTDFECLLHKSRIIIQDKSLHIASLDPQKNSKNEYVFKLETMTNIRQHMVDAFQFIVYDSTGNANEYGLQLQSIAMTWSFRLELYLALTKICRCIIELQCAIAEYDTKSQEFVICSKESLVSILKNSVRDEFFLAVKLPENHTDFHKYANQETNIMGVKSPYIFIGYLSKEIQIWPSPKTNQFTFWGIHHQKIDISHMMFMIEMDCNVIDQITINFFFERLAIILHDRMFLLARTTVDNSIDSEKREKMDDIQDLFDDDRFSVGDLGDETMQKRWKTTRYSIDDHSDEDHSDDAYSDSEITNQHEYNEYENIPKYIKSRDSDVLVHRFMEVGNDRTFVCRGDIQEPGYLKSQYTNDKQKDQNKIHIKVYKRDENGHGLKSVGYISNDKFKYKNDVFNPGKGLLHQQESKLLIVPKNTNQGNVYMMDLEKEKIVQYWKTDPMEIHSMFPTFKKGQTTHDPTFLGANSKNLFMVDTRLDPQKGKSSSYSYTTNPQLSVGTTDSNGGILVGSRLGELRLFDGTCNSKGDFKRAKTLLQTIREPITAVDVNSDGTWILATTKTFLVVFPTKLVNTDKTGFQAPLGKFKPEPRYLMLNSQDVIQYHITDINFSPAKFDSEEDSIVTSTGNMAVVWDFGTVKRGKPFYSIRFAEDTIKDVKITNETSDVVVAYPTAVGLFETEKLKI